MEIHRVIAEEPDVAQRMLEEGADVNQLVGTQQQSPLLHHALKHGRLHIARLLIERGANVFQQNSDYQKPLDIVCSIGSDGVSATRASEEGIYEMCKLLLEKESDHISQSGLGPGLLTDCLLYRSLKIIKLLLDHKAPDATVMGIVGPTALHLAARNPNVDVLEFVLNSRIDIEYATAAGLSSLHYAAWAHNFEGCELLLKRGANANRRSIGQPGDTPLTMALFLFNHDDMEHSKIIAMARTIKVLLEYGANVTEKVYGGSALAQVSLHGGLEFAENLDRYADVRFVLIRHVVKVQYMNGNIYERDKRVIEQSDVCKEYYDLCVRELEDMKQMKFYNNVTIFGILMDSEEVISRYARNEELVQALGEVDYESKFPIYFGWLKKRFYAAVEKHRLWKTAAEFLSDVFMFNDLYHPVIRNILDHLSEEHFKSFCPNFVPEFS